MTFKVPEQHRAVHPNPIRNTKPGELNGYFLIPAKVGGKRVPLRCVASSGQDWAKTGMPFPAWEHVSVSPQPPIKRVPTWEEMCFVKSLFWDPEDAVVQIHPPEANYVNESPFCLHLWRPVGVELPLPPSVCVGTVQSVSGGDAGRPDDQHEFCKGLPAGCACVLKGLPACIRGDHCAVVYAAPPGG